MILPIAVYGAEACGMRSAERKKSNKACGMRREKESLVGVSRMESVRNEEVRRRAGIERELASRVDQRALRCCRHVWRMDEYRVARRVSTAEVRGGEVRGRRWRLRDNTRERNGWRVCM